MRSESEVRARLEELRLAPTRTRSERKKRATKIKRLLAQAEEFEEGSWARHEDTSWVPAYLQSHFWHLRERPAESRSANEEAAIEERIGVSGVARDLMELARDAWVPTPLDEREAWCKDKYTAQFVEESKTDNENGIPLEHVAAAHDARRDETLFPFSKKKRLPLQSAKDNKLEFAEKEFAGRLLFESFNEAYGYTSGKFDFDERLFQQCYEETEKKKLNAKTKAFIQATATERNDPDFDLNRIKVFMKTQQKVNQSTINGKAKAGQTIAQLNERIQMTMAATILYMTKFDDRHRGPHSFRLAGNTMSQAADWSRKWVSGKKFTTNDFTAFDQSQAGEALQFELMRMAQLGIPAEIRDFYKERKLNSYHQVGPSAVIRFTGEAGTYKLNSDYNEAITWRKYHMAGLPYCISGDDSLIVGHAVEREEWALVAKYFKIVAKTERPDQPIFCGYIFSEHGIAREPSHFGMKLAISVSKGKFWDVAASYAHELMQARSLGDKLTEVLTAEQLEWHFAMSHYLWDHGGLRIHAVMSTLPDCDIDGLSVLRGYERRLEDRRQRVLADATLKRGLSGQNHSTMPFTCNTCSASFPTRALLLQHLRDLPAHRTAAAPAPAQAPRRRRRARRAPAAPAANVPAPVAPAPKFVEKLVQREYQIETISKYGHAKLLSSNNSFLTGQAVGVGSLLRRVEIQIRSQAKINVCGHISFAIAENHDAAVTYAKLLELRACGSTAVPSDERWHNLPLGRLPTAVHADNPFIGDKDTFCLWKAKLDETVDPPVTDITPADIRVFLRAWYDVPVDIASAARHPDRV